ncbi:hypothetical protein BJ742DRAFT_842912 [Cladochytrium replicatum]|nr:hypothetical protein BJ742DRAFT_842912 [Cladochytrium replicatum]
MNGAALLGFLLLSAISLQSVSGQDLYYNQVNLYPPDSPCGTSPVIVTAIRNMWGQSECDGLAAIQKSCTNVAANTAFPYSTTACVKVNEANPGTYYSAAGTLRDYVVQLEYRTSSNCTGTPFSLIAAAADDLCHSLTPNFPAADSKGGYVKANCNGETPYWKVCNDAACTDCTTTYAVSNQECTIGGASVSNKVICIRAAAATSPQTSTTTVAAASQPSVDFSRTSAGDRGYRSLAKGTLFMSWACILSGSLLSGGFIILG